MALPDLQKLSDSELDEHFGQVIEEQQRRRNLASIPNQINDLRSRFIECGGNLSDLDKTSDPSQTT